MSTPGRPLRGPRRDFASAVRSAVGLHSVLMEPQRTCVGCRGRSDKTDLVRLVWDPRSAVVLIDTDQRLPGRGCYVHPDCAAIAVKRRAIGRALHTSVDPEQVAAILAPLGSPAVARA